MNNKYDIKIPKSGYIQVISSFLIIGLLCLQLRKEDFISIFVVSILIISSLVQLVLLLSKSLRKMSELETTENTIRINQIEVPIHKIEKIIIQGYFIQSVGIKLYGRKLVSMNLHFKFKDNEEGNTKELKQWASMKGIKVTSGRIYRWI